MTNNIRRSDGLRKKLICFTMICAIPVIGCIPYEGNSVQTVSVFPEKIIRRLPPIPNGSAATDESDTSSYLGVLYIPLPM